MAFKQTGSVQKNAAPLQSAIKKHGLGQKVPDGASSAKSGFVPRAKPPAAGKAAKPQAPGTFFDPVFLDIMSKLMGGR